MSRCPTGKCASAEGSDYKGKVREGEGGEGGGGGRGRGRGEGERGRRRRRRQVNTCPSKADSAQKNILECHLEP